MATKSDATFFQDPALVTSRNSELTGTPMSDVSGDGTYADPYLGCNRAGSCAPGIGIGTGAGPITDTGVALQGDPNSWTLNDQFGDGRTPQVGQHIGDGTGVTAAAPSKGTDPVNVFDVESSDFNDTVDLNATATGWVRTTV